LGVQADYKKPPKPIPPKPSFANKKENNAPNNTIGPLKNNQLDKRL